MIKSIFILVLAVLGHQINAQSHKYLEYDFMLKDTDKELGSLVIHTYKNNTLSVMKYNNGSSQVSMYKEANDSAVYAVSTDKTYWVKPDHQLNKYVIQIIGEEKIGNLNCTKLYVATHVENNFNQVIWISSEITNYEQYLSSVVNNIYHSKLNAALVKFDLKGLIVKVQNRQYERSYQYELQTSDLRLFDESVFDLSEYQQQFPQTRKKLKKQGAISKKQNKAMKQAEKDALKMRKD